MLGTSAVTTDGRMQVEWADRYTHTYMYVFIHLFARMALWLGPPAEGKPSQQRPTLISLCTHQEACITDFERKKNSREQQMVKS